MDELEPVDDAEFVYRRIHPRFFDPTLATGVLFEAFRPNRNDHDGLSVFRARFAQAEDCLPLDSAKTAGYFVARLAVADLRNLGLTVQADPLSRGPPGHALISELNCPAYEADKENWKPTLLALAKLASADIVLRPGK